MNTNKTIEEMLPEKKNVKSEFDVGSEFSTPRIIRDNGYNQAIDDVLLALPAIKNAIYEELFKPKE